MKQTLENIAAIKLAAAEDAMRSAASALDDLGSDEAKLHAKELRGAIKVARGWELTLRRLHGKLTRSNVPAQGRAACGVSPGALGWAVTFDAIDLNSVGSVAVVREHLQ